MSEFTAGKKFADYEIDEMLRSVVGRQFAIIGEAMVQLATADEQMADRISQYRRIIASRNTLIHGYADDRLVWDVIINNLPTLLREVDIFMAEADGQPRELWARPEALGAAEAPPTWLPWRPLKHPTMHTAPGFKGCDVGLPLERESDVIQPPQHRFAAKFIDTETLDHVLSVVPDPLLL